MAPEPLTEAVASGDRRRALTALRDRLAEEIEGSRSSMAIAPMAKQLTDVLKELDGLPIPGEVSRVDELARRAARRREAAGAESA